MEGAKEIGNLHRKKQTGFVYCYWICKDISVLGIMQNFTSFTAPCIIYSCRILGLIVERWIFKNYRIFTRHARQQSTYPKLHFLFEYLPFYMRYALSQTTAVVLNSLFALVQSFSLAKEHKVYVSTSDSRKEKKFF